MEKFLQEINNKFDDNIKRKIAIFHKLFCRNFEYMQWKRFAPRINYITSQSKYIEMYASYAFGKSDKFAKLLYNISQNLMLINMVIDDIQFDLKIESINSDCRSAKYALFCPYEENNKIVPVKYRGPCYYTADLWQLKKKDRKILKFDIYNEFKSFLTSIYNSIEIIETIIINRYKTDIRKIYKKKETLNKYVGYRKKLFANVKKIDIHQIDYKSD